MSGIKNIENKSVIEKIVDQIIGCVISGEFKPGEKIPTEQEFVEIMGVSRNSLREAIKILISYGILEIKRPGGTYVCKGYSSKMLDPLVYGLIIGGDTSKDVVQLRRIVEIGIMNTALDVVTEEGIESISVKLEDLKDKIGKGVKYIDEIVDADVAFHREISLVIMNPLVEIVYDMITKITLFSRKKTILKSIEESNGESMVRVHQNLFDVLKNKNKDNLINAIEDTYISWKKLI